MGICGNGVEFVRIPLEIRAFYSFGPSLFSGKIQKIRKIYNLFEKNGKMWVLMLTTICSGVFWIFYYMGSLLPEIYDFLAVL
jgi:hypothetical protein